MSFGVGQRLYLDGDTVKFGPIEPAYKDYIKTLSEWYSEGLLDRDFATNKDTLIDSNITGGDSGAMMGYLGGGMGRYLEQMQTEDPSYNLVCAQYPTLNKGEKNNFQLFEGDVTSRYLAITTACKDPEAAVKWADNFYGEDGYMLVNFGVEGESYTMEDGYPKYTDKVLHNPDGLTVNEALSLESRATAAAPGFKQAPEYLEQYYQFEQQIDGFKLWSECCDEARKTFIPYGVFPNQSESEEIAALSTDIETYAQEMLLKFVSGQEPIDNYDSFVETLKSKFKVERYLEICQEMYNRYLER